MSVPWDDSVGFQRVPKKVLDFTVLVRGLEFGFHGFYVAKCVLGRQTRERVNIGSLGMGWRLRFGLTHVMGLLNLADLHCS